VTDSFEIRRERAGDRDGVRDVNRAAFVRHPEHVAGLVAALRELITDDRGVSLVAVEGDEIIGHVMFTPSLLDAPQELVTVQVLSPLAVLPAAQRRGVGRTLVRRGVEIVARQGAPVAFLEGEPAYYSRLGFAAGGSLGYRRPSLRIPERAFQAMNLQAHEPWMTGTLIYSHIFWDHDAVGLRGSSDGDSITTGAPESHARTRGDSAAP
jgi:putative acetyltransferase